MNCEIKEPGFFGKTIYVVKNDGVYEPGLLGKKVYSIKGSEIYEPGFFGKKVYAIKNNGIYEPGFFGKKVYAIKNNGIYEPGFFGKELFVIVKNKVKEEKKSNTVEVTITATVGFVEAEDETKELEIYERNGLIYHTISKTENGYHMVYSVPEYNEVLVYYRFLKKYSTVKKPELLNESDYVHWDFYKIGINEVSKLHKEIYSKGFYRQANNREILSQLKVVEIKNIIQTLNLNVKGKREDLINGLISQANCEELANILGDEYCSLSDFGIQWMKDNELTYNWYTSVDDYATFDEYLSKRK